MADRALAEVRRAALARLHRDGRARALLRGGRGRRDRLGEGSPASTPRAALHRRPQRVDHRLVAGLGGAELDHAGQRRRRARRRAGPVEPARRRSRGRRGAGPCPRGARWRRRRSRPASCRRRSAACRAAGPTPSSASITAWKPRVMLMPWSPSPIAESSCVRCSASAATAAATSCIQVVTSTAVATVVRCSALTPPSGAPRCGPEHPTARSAHRRARAPSATRRPSRAT